MPVRSGLDEPDDRTTQVIDMPNHVSQRAHRFDIIINKNEAVARLDLVFAIFRTHKDGGRPKRTG